MVLKYSSWSVYHISLDKTSNDSYVMPLPVKTSHLRCLRWAHVQEGLCLYEYDFAIATLSAFVIFVDQYLFVHLRGSSNKK